MSFLWVFIPEPSGVLSISINYIFTIIVTSEEANIDRRLEYMEKYFLDKYCIHEEQQKMNNTLSIIKHQFKVKWQAGYKKKSVFEKKKKIVYGSVEQLLYLYI